jgi:predicted O-methyltransferase YrrM
MTTSRLVDRIRGRMARVMDGLGVFGLAWRLPADRRAELVADLFPGTLSRSSFRAWEERGFHVTPVHYYQAIPDTRTLGDRPWRRRSPLHGITLREDEQEALIRRLTRYKAEYDAFPDAPTADPRQFHWGNQAFGPVDAEVLYAMVRHWRPARVVEVGSGWSTRLIAQAIRQNQREEPGRTCRFTTIDPEPDPVLGEVAEVVAASVQDVDPKVFADLRRDDLLFIDSSHVVKIGSDVNLEVLEILPSLAPGVLVHFHDIFLPAEYPRTWIMDNHWFWTEQYLLQAFLSYNEAFEVLLANHWLHLTRPDLLAEAFARYSAGVQPASLWLRRR